MAWAKAVDERHAPFCLQDGVVQGPAGAGLAGRQAEHDPGGDCRPDDPGDAVSGVMCRDQNDDRLDRDVDGQRHEGRSDQPQGPPLPVLADP